MFGRCVLIVCGCGFCWVFEFAASLVIGLGWSGLRLLFCGLFCLRGLTVSCFVNYCCFGLLPVVVVYLLTCFVVLFASLRLVVWHLVCCFVIACDCLGLRYGFVNFCFWFTCLCGYLVILLDGCLCLFLSVVV